jgi:hypothetical protein
MPSRCRGSPNWRQLRLARAGAVTRAQLDAVARAYLEFAENQPALYDAAEADQRDLDVLTEVGWSALHGLAMLTRTGRLRPDLRERRLPQLLELLRGTE